MTTDTATMPSLYPTTWDQFIGQDQLKRQLQVATESARRRGQPISHTLLASPVAGAGKTSLALLMANQAQVGVKMASGVIDVNEARILIASMNDHDILLLDEVHRLVAGGKQKAEWLLHVLQDGVIVGPRGPETIPAITVVATTTEASRLPTTIVSRFPMRPTIEPYTATEAAQIAIILAAKILLKPLPWPTERCFHSIARAANNNPRTIGAILVNLRDLAVVENVAVIDDTSYILDEALKWLGLCADGMTQAALDYLRVMRDDFGGQAGEQAMKDRLGDPNLITTESLLLDRGFITKTRAGRVLSMDGLRRIEEDDRG